LDTVNPFTYTILLKATGTIYSSHNTHEKLSLHATRSATKIIQMKRDIEHNPYKNTSNTPGGVQAFCLPPP
jgi:hypothetical protein